MDNWRLVTDWEPSPRIPVLLLHTSTGGVWIGRRLSERSSTFEVDWTPLPQHTTATHWMPLPEGNLPEGKDMDDETTIGVELIADERRRQIEEEGWSAGHDDGHDEGELGRAAQAYVEAAIGGAEWVTMWPRDPEQFKPTTPIWDLVKAGALIAAEIDRRLRVKVRKK